MLFSFYPHCWGSGARHNFINTLSLYFLLHQRSPFPISPSVASISCHGCVPPGCVCRDSGPHDMSKVLQFLLAYDTLFSYIPLDRLVCFLFHPANTQCFLLACLELHFISSLAWTTISILVSIHTIPLSTPGLSVISIWCACVVT